MKLLEFKNLKDFNQNLDILIGLLKSDYGCREFATDSIFEFFSYYKLVCEQKLKNLNLYNFNKIFNFFAKSYFNSKYIKNLEQFSKILLEHIIWEYIYALEEEKIEFNLISIYKIILRDIKN